MGMKEFLEGKGDLDISLEDAGDERLVVNIDQIWSTPEGQQFFTSEQQEIMQRVLNNALMRVSTAPEFKELLGKALKQTRDFDNVSDLIDKDFKEFIN